MRVRRSIGAYTWRTWGRELARDELFDSVSLMVVGNDGGWWRTFVAEEMECKMRTGGVRNGKEEDGCGEWRGEWRFKYGCAIRHGTRE